jgi:hypothetical protein
MLKEILDKVNRNPIKTFLFYLIDEIGGENP